MGNLGDALQKSINRLGVARQVEAVGVVERATEEIARFVPREDFEVVSFNRGTLKIKAANAVVASEINLQREKVKNLPVKVIKIST